MVVIMTSAAVITITTVVVDDGQLGLFEGEDGRGWGGGELDEFGVEEGAQDVALRSWWRSGCNVRNGSKGNEISIYIYTYQLLLCC